MSIDNSNHENNSALVPDNRTDHYHTALQVARELNAEFASNKGLKPFTALNLRDEHILPVVAAVSVAGAILTGIATLIAVSRRAERQIAPANEPESSQSQLAPQATMSRALVIRTDIYRTQLTVISQFTVTKFKSDSDSD